MARYVVANRRADKVDDSEQRAARAAMDRAVASVAPRIDVVGDNEPRDETRRRVMVVEADPLVAAELASAPDVLVEPEILHWPVTSWPSDFLFLDRASLALPVAP